MAVYIIVSVWVEKRTTHNIRHTIDFQMWAFMAEILWNQILKSTLFSIWLFFFSLCGSNSRKKSRTKKRLKKMAMYRKVYKMMEYIEPNWRLKSGNILTWKDFIFFSFNSIEIQYRKCKSKMFNSLIKLTILRDR